MKYNKVFTKTELKEELVITQRQVLTLEKNPKGHEQKLENLKQEVKNITNVLSK